MVSMCEEPFRLDKIPGRPGKFRVTMFLTISHSGLDDFISIFSDALEMNCRRLSLYFQQSFDHDLKMTFNIFSDLLAMMFADDIRC